VLIYLSSSVSFRYLPNLTGESQISRATSDLIGCSWKIFRPHPKNSRDNYPCGGKSFPRWLWGIRCGRGPGVSLNWQNGRVNTFWHLSNDGQKNGTDSFSRVFAKRGKKKTGLIGDWDDEWLWIYYDWYLLWFICIVFSVTRILRCFPYLYFEFWESFCGQVWQWCLIALKLERAKRSYSDHGHSEPPALTKSCTLGYSSIPPSACCKSLQL